MMRMRTSKATFGAAIAVPKDERGSEGKESEWEVRPGGMLVQKRSANAEKNLIAPPTIKVRVKYGASYHEIAVSSQASFGELKKMLSGPTGLHHQDQKIYYKDKERDSRAFLDSAGVKDKSKLLLVEDPISHEKRLIEMRNNAKNEKASKLISDISLDVDRLAGQVSAMETIVSKGKRVAEKDVTNLIELLMNQLLKLDGINAEGDAKLQRKMQVRRVQKYVETLDVMKGRSARKQPAQFVQKLAPIVEQTSVPPLLIELDGIEEEKVTPSSTVVTTQWETFETTPSSGNNYTANNRPQFPWDF